MIGDAASTFKKYTDLQEDYDKYIQMEKVNEDDESLKVEMDCKRMYWQNTSLGKQPLMLDNSKQPESKKSKKDKKALDSTEEVAAPVSVNSCAFFQDRDRNDLFITVDDNASLKIWDCQK